MEQVLSNDGMPQGAEKDRHISFEELVSQVTLLAGMSTTFKLHTSKTDHIGSHILFCSLVSC